MLCLVAILTIYHIRDMQFCEYTSFENFLYLLVMFRELAIQIAEQFEALGSSIGVKCAVVSFFVFAYYLPSYVSKQTYRSIYYVIVTIRMTFFIMEVMYRGSSLFFLYFYIFCSKLHICDIGGS